MLDLEWRDYDDMEKGIEIWWSGSDFPPGLSEKGEIVLPLDWDEVDSLISLALAYRELKSTKKRLGLPLFMGPPLFKDAGGDEEGNGGNSGNGEEILNYGGTK